MAGTWKSKLPEDMTLEELQAAKAELTERFATVSAEYTWMSAAVQHVDYQVASRFGLTNIGAGHINGLPAYPLNNLNGTAASTGT